MLSKTHKAQVLKNLQATDWDIIRELGELDSRVKERDLPRLRIEHHKQGKHRFYLDFGESYMEGDKQYTYLGVKTLPAIVFAEQQIRALWNQDEDTPRCYSIDDQVMASAPISDSCQRCPESIRGAGACKPKVRLFILPLLKKWRQAMVMSLSPTSIKPWREHQLRLHRSGLPPVAVVTTFELEDLQTEDFRWARVIVGIRGIASKANLLEARNAGQSILSLKHRLGAMDFGESGDRKPAEEK